jgi:hypothetical protein
VVSAWPSPPPADDLQLRLLGAEGEWRVEQKVSQDLQQLATDALVGGLDCHSLRLLAGADADGFPGDLLDLFAAALAELGAVDHGQRASLRAFVAQRCWLVSSGTVAPGAGAAYILEVGYLRDEPETDNAVVDFMTLEEELGEPEWGRPSPEIEREILARATAIVDAYRRGEPFPTTVRAIADDLPPRPEPKSWLGRVVRRLNES